MKNAYPELDVSIKEVDVAPLSEGPKSKTETTEWRRNRELRTPTDHAQIADVPVVITRTVTSEVGYEVYLTRIQRPEVTSLMKPASLRHPRRTFAAGASRSDLHWGAEMTSENMPSSGAREVIDFEWPTQTESQGAYQRSKRRDPQKINGVVIDGEPFPDLNNTKWPASVDGRQVGKVTSAIYSPRLRQNLGYCWLPTENSRQGQQVTIDSEWGQRTATVTPMPFVDPEKRIPIS